MAQIALDEQDIVQNQNNYEINMLNLKQLMLLEPGYPMEIEKPIIDINSIEPYETYMFDAVYGKALSSQPNIRASELRLKSAELDVQIAEGASYPTLSIGGSLGSSYSNLGKMATGFRSDKVPIDGAYLNGESVLLEVTESFPTGFEITPYFDQIDNNFGYGFSAQLNIPIYNNYNTKSNVERSKLNIISTQLNNEQVKQTLKTNIQNALASARAARESLDAAERSLEASEIAYQNTQKRYELGAVNTFDFINSKNRFDQAQVSLTIAKYEYIFRAKVIEYYLGRGLQLD
jgi:outer membrane protein